MTNWLNDLKQYFIGFGRGQFLRQHAQDPTSDLQMN